MTMLILWVAYSAIAVLLDCYLCQDPQYAVDTPSAARAGIGFLWPIVLVILCISPKERRGIEAAIERRKAAKAATLDQDIAEVLQLIEYEKYRSDPWVTLQSQPRGSEQCR